MQVLSINDWVINENVKSSSTYYKFNESSYQRLIRSLLESNFFGSDENLALRYIYENSLSEQFLVTSNSFAINEETLANWIQQKAKNAKELIANGSEKVSDGMKILAQYGVSFMKYVKLIGGYILKFLKSVWSIINKSVHAALEKGKGEFVNRVKKKKFDKTNLKKECDQFKQMAQGGLNWVVSGLVKDMNGAIAKTGNEDINESIISIFADLVSEDTNFLNEMMAINENDKTASIPFISKIASKLNHFPPFKWLHSFEETVSEKTNNALEKLSIFLSERGHVQGPFEFLLLGIAVGLTAAYHVEHSIVHLVEEVGMKAIEAGVIIAIPAIGFILTIMKNIAKGLWVVGVLEEVVLAVSDLENHEQESETE